MKLAKCSGRDKCGDTSCAHYGDESGVHVVFGACRINGCFEVPGSSCEIENIAVVPVSVLKMSVEKMCQLCKYFAPPLCFGTCDVVAPLQAAIAEAEEESHGTDA